MAYTVIIYAMYYIMHFCLKSIIRIALKVVFLKKEKKKRGGERLRHKEFLFQMFPKKGPTLQTDILVGCLYHKNKQGKRS